MPFRDRFSRAKRKAKQYLGVSSDHPSSTSLPVSTSSSPSTVPQTIPQANTTLLRGSHAPGASRSSFTADQLASNHASRMSPPAPGGTALASATVPRNPPPVSSAAPSVSGDVTMVSEANDQQRVKPVAWSGLKTLLKVVESSSDVFPPLKSAVSGLNKCIDIFESASKDRKEYQELQKKLDALLGDLSEHIGGTNSANITMGMRNLCIVLNEELVLLQRKGARGGLQRHAEALEESNEIMECYRRIQGHLERLTLNANLSIWETVDELAREARLKRLSASTSAVYNSAKSEEIQRRTCTEGTRKEELTKLLGWARNKEGEEVYWMNGMAGTGKTTIAYSLCAELEATAHLGASFFCSRLIPECRDVKLIIPSIAYQLARFSFPFCSVLLSILKADPDVHTRTLKAQFDSLVVKPLLEVEHALPTDLTVIIDALDECENEGSVGQILDVLLSHTTAPRPPIRFLISSRPEPLIYSRMMRKLGAKHEARLVLHELDEKKVRHDIETYLKAELAEIDLKPSQLEDLATHCGVLFIYASTAARYIKEGPYLKQRETRLNIILGLVPPSKNGKERDIDTLYMSILKSALENPRLDESDQSLTKAILDTVICVQEPMTTATLARLLGLSDVDQAEGLLGPLRSVLNIAEKSGLVTTLHASFPDFLLDSGRSADFRCDLPKTHAQITRSCFVVIGANIPQFNLSTLESSYLRDKEVPDFAERVEPGISAELFYACRYWLTHLELGGGNHDESALIHEFLSQRLLGWMEVLNLKESMHLGPRIMQLAERWSRAHECRNDTIDLAHDAWRFVTMYTSHAVSQSTPHIYISMLPFWPESAPVSRHYTPRMGGAVRVQGSGMTRRQLALLATWPLGGEVRSFCFSRDEGLIACAVDSSVWILDGATGRAILGPLEHSDLVKDITFSHDGTLLVSCSDDKTVKVWGTKNGELATEPFKEHTDYVNSIALLPDGKRVVSGSRDRTIRVWSLESGRTVVGPLRGPNNGVWSISVSSDGSRIASGYFDGTIQVWSAGSGQVLLGPFTSHTKCVRSVCFSPDGMRLASGSDDNTIRLWSDLDGQAQADMLKGHSRQVTSVAFSPDGKQIVSGSVDDTVRLWDVQGTPQLARVFTGHTNVVWCVRFSSDGARIVSSSADRTIRVWDARSQGPADSLLEGHTEAVSSVAFSHGGSRIVSGSNDGTIYVWDGQSGQVAVGPTKGHSDWVCSVCVSPDGSRIASGSKDESVQLWNAYTGQALGKPLTGHSGEVLSVCFSPDGALLASSSNDKAIRLWNAASGEPVGSPFEGHTGYVLSVFFSPDNRRLVSGSGDKTILVWDVNTRKHVLPPLKGHTDQVWAVCVSSDGTRIASGSNDTNVRLWDANDGQGIIGPLLGHTACVNSVCFSPNGSYVISGSDDKTIRLWDARSGEAIGSPLVGHTDLVLSVAFSPDGGQIVSGSVDETIRVWDIADLVQPQEPEDDIKKGTEPSRAHQSWVLQDDGWVVDSQSRLLAWVPPDLHASLMSPRNPLLISTKGSVQLDLDSAKIGESWAESYEPAS